MKKGIGIKEKLGGKRNHIVTTGLLYIEKRKFSEFSIESRRIVRFRT